MGDSLWVKAAEQVLLQSDGPLHYTDIKRVILESQLVPSGTDSSLEAALFKEIQKPSSSIRSIPGQPGMFFLQKEKKAKMVSKVSILKHSKQPVPRIKVITPATAPGDLQMASQAALMQAKVASQTEGSSDSETSGHGKHPSSKYDVDVVSASSTEGGKAGLVSHVASGRSSPKLLGQSKAAARLKAGGQKVTRVKVVPTGARSGAERYKAKYIRLKKMIKDMVFTNAAVCDEVVRIEEKIQRSKEERRYLLRRLLQQEAKTGGGGSQVASTAKPSSSTSPVGNTALPGKHTTQSIAQILGEVEKRKRKVSGSGGGASALTKKKLAEDINKVKVKKAKPIQNNRHLVQPILLDNCGRPVFPIELGNLTVFYLGEIMSDKPNYHTSDQICPVGFCSTRVFVSTQNPEQKCLYTCKITDAGNAPKFEISPEDFPQMVIHGNTADEAHLQLLKTINQTRPTEVVPLTAKGGDFFGITHPTIQNLIQSCPGARKCYGYKWVKFEVSRSGEYYIEDDPTVNVDVLFALPSYVKAAAQTTNLRTLLTNKSA